MADCVVALDAAASQLFSKWGRMVARRPVATIVCCVVFLALAGSGVVLLDVQSDPEKIWVPPTSQTALQQNHFNKVFDPFYRIEQVIFSAKDNVTYVSAFLVVVSAALAAIVPGLCVAPCPRPAVCIASVTSYLIVRVLAGSGTC